MPQLDQVTFLSQFLWLSLSFFGFYFVICKDFLPKMGRILKFRKKKMNLSAEGVKGMHQEIDKVRASGKAVTESGLHVGNHLLLSHVEKIHSFLTRVSRDVNERELSKCNSLYVEWVGDNSIRQQLALQGATLFPAPRIFASILAEKCKGKGREKQRFALNTPSSRPDSLDQPLVEKGKRN